MALNKILLSDNVTELTGVKSVVYKEVTSADVNIHGGCVCSASIEVEVYGSQATAVSAGDVVYYYQYDKNNTATLVGIFNCEPVIETKTSYKFVAYDNAQKLKADFSQWLQANQSNFPMTVYALVSAACTVAGTTLGSLSWGLSTQNVQAFYSDGITCRDILSYAAEIGCCFVRCHTDGNVYFDWFSSNANTIAPSVGTGQYAYKQDGLNYANYTTAALDRVAVHPSGEDDVAYIYPTGITSGNTLHIQNNLLLTGADAAFYNAVAQQVYTVMSALGTYRPMTANLFVKENPFRAGDIVSVTDSQSVTFTSIITGMTVSESGAVLESTGNETYDEGTGNTQKAITQLASDVVRINKLKVDWADINTAIINYLTANNVTAQNLTIVDEHGNVLATYDSSGITLGDASEVHAEVDFNSFKLYDKDGNLYASIGDARDANGLADINKYYSGNGSKTIFNINPPANDTSTITVYVNGSVITTGYTATVNNITFSTAPSSSDWIQINYKTSEPCYQYRLGTLISESTPIGLYAFVAGKKSSATGNYSVVGGGESNTATGADSVVSGGAGNTVNYDYGTISGGLGNTTYAPYATISGGESNVANGLSNVISGGESNHTFDNYSTVSGGKNNTADGDYSTVAGGYNNKTNNANRATISGGYNNYATGTGSTIVGGESNKAVGNYSTISGRGNYAKHLSQFVFGEYNIVDPSSSASTARGNYVEIVGNGTSSSSTSNARTLDWDGKEWLSGSLEVENDSTASDGGIIRTRGTYSLSNLPPSTNYSYGITFRDAAKNVLGYIRNALGTGGASNVFIAARNIVSGSGQLNSLSLQKNTNGDDVVNISAPLAWRKALELNYAVNDTFSISSNVSLIGSIHNTSLTDAYFDCVVDKSMEDISTVTVTTLNGTLRGVSGNIDSSSAINFVSSSAYTVSATKQSDRHVRIRINKSSGFTNATVYTPVVYWGSIGLKFT